MNFSGGEPFIHKRGKYLGELVKYCKKDLQLPSVSIVSNGSLVTEKWFQEYGENATRLFVQGHTRWFHVYEPMCEQSSAIHEF